MTSDRRRYFYHPESGSLWFQYKALERTDGLVEEIDLATYEKLVRQAQDGREDDHADIG